jgi:hypothetical protein
MVCPSKDQSCICTIPERERERDVKSHISQLEQNITSLNKIGLDELTYQ